MELPIPWLGMIGRRSRAATAWSNAGSPAVFRSDWQVRTRSFVFSASRLAFPCQGSCQATPTAPEARHPEG